MNNFCMSTDSWMLWDNVVAKLIDPLVCVVYLLSLVYPPGVELSCVKELIGCFQRIFSFRIINMSLWMVYSVFGLDVSAKLDFYLLLVSKPNWKFSPLHDLSRR